MTRVLVWQETFWPHVGGVEVLATKLFVALKRRGYDIVVATRQDSLDLPREDNYQEIPVYRYPFWQALASGNLGQVMKLRSRVAQLKRTFAPDLIHVNCFGPSAVFHHDTTNAHSGPLLLTLHTTDQTINGGSLRHDGLLKRTLCTASWVNCVSKAVLAYWNQLAPEINAYSSVTYNGMVTPALRPKPLPSNPPCLLCVGRLHRDKGFDLALKAFALVLDHFPDVRLVVVGEGEERAFLEREAADMRLKNVEFAGWVTPAKIFELINSSTVVIVPSRREGLPTVALEAGLMARPVIGTRVGGVPEIVVEKKTGLLTNPEDWQALAQSIEYLLLRPNLATAFGLAARTRIQSLFSFERYVDAYDALYRKLIMEARGKSTVSTGAAHG